MNELVKLDVIKYLQFHTIERPNKIKLFMDIAVKFSSLSTCIRSKVGSIIVDKNLTRIASIGYNGQYRKGPNHCLTLEAGNCGCLHSEINSLVKFKEPNPENYVIMITQSPCYSCMSAIINSGIKFIIYDELYRISNHISIMCNEENGVTCKSLKEELESTTNKIFSTI